MAAKSLNQILAENLAYFMSRPGCPYHNPNALGVAAKISSNTVRNFLDADRRPAKGAKSQGYPTLDKLEAIATVLNRDVWELLHPDIQRSIREREMYARIAADFQSLPPDDPNADWRSKTVRRAPHNT